MASINIDFTKFTFDEIKEALRDSLRNDGIITDFEYEGSNTDTILNILSYVTTMLNHNINYMSNEAFLGTAQNRKNILKHAQALNYKVNRKTSAKIKIKLKFYLGKNRIINIPRYSSFFAADGTQFLTTDAIFEINNTDSTKYVEKDIELIEGKVIDYTSDESLKFIFNPYEHNTILLKYKDIENTSIILYAQTSNEPERVFTESKNLLDDLMLSNNVFITEYDPETEFVRIRMLDRYGIVPKNGDTIKIEFLLSKGAKGNNYRKLLPKIVNDYDINPNISTINEVAISVDVLGQNISYGGADEESNDEIVTYAPLVKSSAGRLVTALDWEANLVSMQTVSSPSVWGGEEIGTDLSLNGFTTFQKESLKKPGKVYISAIPSNNNEYFNINEIEDIKTLIRDNSIVSLQKQFLQPIHVGFDLVITAEKTKDNTILSDKLTNQIISVCDNYFIRPFNLQFKKAKLINLIYSINGIDNVSLDGSKITMSISGVNFYDDTEDFLDVTLPISKVQSPLNLTKITSSEPKKYTFSFVDIPTGLGTSTKYDYNPYLDSFLDHIGIQPLNYFVWDENRTYQIGDIIMYPDRESGYIYECIISNTSGTLKKPEGGEESNAYWQYLPMTSKYMDKTGKPIDFSNYKRITIQQQDGKKFTKPVATDANDYYSEGDLVWDYSTTNQKIIYFISKVNLNKSTNVYDTKYWEQLEISAQLVAEGEITIGTYMKEENIFRLYNAMPRKLSTDILSQNIFVNNTEFNTSTTRGIITKFNKSDLIQINGIDYICRFDIEIPLYYSGHTYSTNDLVYTNDGTFWISLQDGNTNHLNGTINSYWSNVDDWNSSTIYSTDDLVVYLNKCWKSLTIQNQNKTPAENKYWTEVISSIVPSLDTNMNLWLPYTNSYKYNKDIFSSNIYDFGITSDKVTVSGEKRSFYFDSDEGVDGVDISNLKFKRELKCFVNSKSISYI